MSKAVYLDEIKNLVELQKVDDARFDKNQELKNAPREIKNLEERFASAEAKRNHILDKLAHLQEQQKRLVSEMDDDSARIRKSKNKLMQVGNTREYQAVMREMDSMEKSNRTREEEKIAILDELQVQNNALAATDIDYTALKSELEVKSEGLEEKLKKAQEELQVLDKKRANACGKISAPVLRRYEFIRSRIEHPVIVAVKDGVCTGCHIAVPPQVYIELQRGQQILDCPNCQRLIFWNEHFDETEDAVPSKKQVPLKD